MRSTSIAPSETPPQAAALALPAGVMSVSSRKEDARQKPGSVGIATADSGGRGALAAKPMQSTSKNLKQHRAEDSGGRVTEQVYFKGATSTPTSHPSCSMDRAQKRRTCPLGRAWRLRVAVAIVLAAWLCVAIVLAGWLCGISETAVCQPSVKREISVLLLLHELRGGRLVLLVGPAEGT